MGNNVQGTCLWCKCSISMVISMVATRPTCGNWIFEMCLGWVRTIICSLLSLYVFDHMWLGSVMFDSVAVLFQETCQNGMATEWSLVRRENPIYSVSIFRVLTSSTLYNEKDYLTFRPEYVQFTLSTVYLKKQFMGNIFYCICLICSKAETWKEFISI